MTYIKIIKYDDCEDYELIAEGDRDEIVQAIAHAITQDDRFFDAYEVAEVFFNTFGKSKN